MTDTQTSWLDLDDAALLSRCAVDTYRASGPGGQKRNKTSSAIRLRHEPTGIMVIAAESRSQHENKARAVKRLREAIALTQRRAISATDPLPESVSLALKRAPGLRVSARHPDYWRIMQYVLDLLVAQQGSVGDAADRLNISTAQLTRFLHADDKLWAHTNRIRREMGLHPLT